MRFVRSVVALLVLSLVGIVPASAAARKVRKPSQREASELLLPRYRLNAQGELAPDVHAVAAIVYDPATGAVLYEQNAQAQRSIASITKVMTATVALDENPNLQQSVTVTAQDVRLANHTYLRPNDRVTVDDLFHLMLIGSDNAAARVLARITSSNFVQRMNEKAQALGLTMTRYADPSGLQSENVSSAYDMARLISFTSANDYVSNIMRIAQYSVRTTKRIIAVRTTDHLLMHERVLAAKTGFINQSGYCIASVLQTPMGFPVTVVVLGAKSNAARFIEAQNLFKWYVYRTQTLLTTLGTSVKVRNDGRSCVYPTTVSRDGLDFIRRHEGFKAHPYRDFNGHYLIGYGMQTWKGRVVVRSWPRVVTRDEADIELILQIDKYRDIVSGSVCVSDMTQTAYDALVDVAYNLGRINTKIREKMNAGVDVMLSDFLSTATVRRRVHPVLRERRTQEYEMFSGESAIIQTVVLNTFQR
jgi:D-alanyl-D-alanine endopeptidase (penicillin-binding protein 7)